MDPDTLPPLRKRGESSSSSSSSSSYDDIHLAESSNTPTRKHIGEKPIASFEQHRSVHNVSIRSLIVQPQVAFLLGYGLFLVITGIVLLIIGFGFLHHEHTGILFTIGDGKVTTSTWMYTPSLITIVTPASELLGGWFVQEEYPPPLTIPAAKVLMMSGLRSLAQSILNTHPHDAIPIYVAIQDEVAAGITEEAWASWTQAVQVALYSSSLETMFDPGQMVAQSPKMQGITMWRAVNEEVVDLEWNLSHQASLGTVWVGLDTVGWAVTREEGMALDEAQSSNVSNEMVRGESMPVLAGGVSGYAPAQAREWVDAYHLIEFLNAFPNALEESNGESQLLLDVCAPQKTSRQRNIDGVPVTIIGIGNPRECIILVRRLFVSLSAESLRLSSSMHHKTASSRKNPKASGRQEDGDERSCVVSLLANGSDYCNASSRSLSPYQCLSLFECVTEQDSSAASYSALQPLMTDLCGEDAPGVVRSCAYGFEVAREKGSQGESLLPFPLPHIKYAFVGDIADIFLNVQAEEGDTLAEVERLVSAHTICRLVRNKEHGDEEVEQVEGKPAEHLAAAAKQAQRETITPLLSDGCFDALYMLQFMEHVLRFSRDEYQQMIYGIPSMQMKGKLERGAASLYFGQQYQH